MKESIDRHKHIVFCDDHYNPLGIVRSLGEYGIKPYVVSLNSKAQMIRYSKFVQEYHIIHSISEGFGFIIDRYGNEEEKPFLYVGDDRKMEYLDKHFDELKDKFFFFNAGGNDKVSKYMNKETISLLATKNGINVPDFISVKAGVIPNRIEYPIITKSITSTVGAWKKDVFICKNEDELKTAYKKIQAPDILIQRYIEKKDEVCIDGFACNQGKNVFYSVESYNNYILPDTYSPFIKLFNFNDNELKKKLNKIFEEIGYEGIFCVDFVIDKNDNLYFCEINFRNAAWSYASTCVGMNLPILWAKCVSGETKFNEGLFTHEIKDDCNAIVEISDIKARVFTRKISIFKWISDFRKSKCRFYMGKRDFGPVIACLTKIVKH